MTIGQYIPADYQRKARIKLALGALDTKGGVFKMLNPFGFQVLIERVILDVTTKTTGACTIDVGVDADGATGDDTLLDGLDIGTAAILSDNLETPGTNGQSCVKWGATQYIVASMASGAAAGAVGSAYVEFSRL